ncbi:PREDICTED: uncharacterized protein LOC104778487 [Camelina sativa]|uniref:Uncharacterized protein LOC104778487 n=1 Tax=Camelina sativa TaxID=90675 RepID=A0ABM0YI81_CAMSA|nr:PREDICTED: uncharacterized protein LOC104778487 [Camelina sativa]
MISEDHKQQVGDNELLTTVAAYDTKVNKTVVREGSASKRESDYQSIKQEDFVVEKKLLQQPESTSEVFKVLQGVDSLQHNGKKGKGSKSWMFKYKNQRHVLEKLQSDSVISVSHSVFGVVVITIQRDELSAVTFSWLAATLQSISEDSLMQRRCRMWLRQTLQDLQQFKHKWRFKLLHIVSELTFSLETVAISLAKYLVQKPLFKVAGKCREKLHQMTMVLPTHLHFGGASRYVWHRFTTQSSQNFVSQVWDPGGLFQYSLIST